MNETKYWLWLTMIFGIGSRRIWEIMCLCDTAKDAYLTLTDDDCPFNLSQHERQNIAEIRLSTAEKVIDACAAKGVYTVCYSAPGYPAQLRHIMDPPAVLYYKGDIGCLCGTRTVTCVGARKASEYSLRSAGRICGELARSGIVIVSGFALGIDIASHLGAVESGRPTAAVMGCGVDVDYPRDNFRYRGAVLENGGVFISEYPPGTPPHSQNFPKRNRILAALGRASVVFEASQRSGSLITAAMSAEQGREVFVMPPADIFSERYSGNMMLLREGALPLLGSADVLDLFRIGGVNDAEIRQEVYRGISSFNVGTPLKRPAPTLIEELVSEAGRPKRRTKKPSPKEEAPVKETAPEPEAPSGPAPVKESYESLTEAQKSIVDALRVGALHADILAERLEMDPGELMVELTELEILGEIRSLPGKIFEIG
ncbi:MAG: DNA-processing protein DprA [Ruminococcus sp.]|nr:DNA-processing protein DprA [Ruminococcus sp.]